MTGAPAAGAPVACITGAASGIGRATALLFARAGYAVAAADQDEVGGEETAALAKDSGVESLFVRTDVTVDAEVRSFFDTTMERFGRIDAVVNNAGISPPKRPFPDTTAEEWARVVAVNLTGVWSCMKHALPHLVVTQGAVVNISSRTALTGSPQRAPYAATKQAVLGLTKSAALEYADRGVRINAVCPGPTETAILAEALGDDPAVRARTAQSTAMGRLGRADEIAAAIFWLCSPAASYVTGVNLPVDGGTRA